MAYFWKLLLAHLLADFPLQPYILVQRKSDPGFFLTHLFIQFIAMVVLLRPLTGQVVLVLLVITLFHGLLDRAKPRFTGKLGISGVGAYFLDQFLHLLSLALAAFVLSKLMPAAAGVQVEAWVIQALALVFSTYVWSITERVLAEENPSWLRELLDFQRQRVLLRTLPVASLILWHYAGGMAGLTSAWLFPYARLRYWRRAVVADALVVLGACGFMLALT
jgi:hypothetical protein